MTRYWDQRNLETAFHSAVARFREDDFTGCGSPLHEREAAVNGLSQHQTATLTPLTRQS